MFCPNCGAPVETPPLLRCPQCGTEATGNIKFCPNCGSKMLEQRNCVMCGSPLVAGTQFCPQCGANQQVILQNSKQKVLNDVIREDMAIQKAEDRHPVKTVIAEESKPIEETDVRTDEKEDKVKEIKRDNEKEDNNESKSHVDESVENDNDTDSEYEEWDEDHSSKRKYLIVGIAFTVALLGVGGWYYLSHHNTEVVVEEYADTQMVCDENNQNVSDEKVATKDIDAGMPSFSQLSLLYESIGKNNSSQQFAQNGFQLVDKESKEEEDDEYDEPSTYTVYKYSYKTRYNLVNGEGYMNAECVYSPNFGDPSMTIRCDRDTWDYMKNTAKNTMKEFSTNCYFLNNYAFIGFENTNIITITSENSISWGKVDIDDEEAKLLSEMAARNIEREANRQELENEKSSNNDVANSENAPTLQMEGYIGEYRVIMHLNIRGSKAEGNYHYNNNSNSNKLYLNGDYNNGKLVLHETTDEGRPTGTFEGVLSGDEFSGEFVNYKGERFAFILQKK